MVVELFDLVSYQILRHGGVKNVRVVSDNQGEYWIDLVFRTKKESYPAKYYMIFQVRL